MPATSVWLSAALGLVAVIGLALAYFYAKYSPIIVRIFQEMPMFRPVRTEPQPGGENVRFRSEDGLELVGTYYATSRPRRLGQVVFCHEFLGDRHSVHHYADHLRDLGFDLFTFDFRNHGESESEPGYEPIQWVSDRDRRDLRAALNYLRTRPDYDTAGVGLFGVSRGGGISLCLAADDPSIWGVVTDGAFPTRGTMLAYIRRWAEIYLPTPWLASVMPGCLYRFIAVTALLRSERQMARKFADVERAASRIRPRPWLAIHGAQDNYIKPEIARELVAISGENATFWLVPKAKHNRCVEVVPAEYEARVADFFLAHAPRRPAEVVPATDREGEVVESATSRKRRAPAAPITG